MIDQTKVLIGVVTQEYARRSDFYDHYSAIQFPPNTLRVSIHDRSPATGRNIVITQALERECSHILFMDDDVIPEPDALMRLLKHDKDIVSGLLLTKSYPHPPLIFDVADETGACLYSYLDEQHVGLREIVAAGLGFILIKTDVFHVLEKPWIRLGELDPTEWCDDIGFFNRVRKAGFKIYCDMDVRVGHIGSMILKPIFSGGKWYTGYDTGGKGVVNTLQVGSMEQGEVNDRKAS